MRVSIVIRSLNEKESLLQLLAIIDQQDYKDYEIIVVDNQSTDGTYELVEQRKLKIISISREEFTFPRSLNVGAQAAMGDIIVFLVGHALPFSKTWLRNGISHFYHSNVAGVYSPVIPRKQCTLAEMLFYWPGYVVAKMRGPHRVVQTGMGVFGATNIALRKTLWEEHPFDERYGLGGEDGEWAQWVISQGYDLVCDYRFAVQHSHGLGFWGLKQQIAYWNKLSQPTSFDRKEFGFRKDLKF